MIPWIVGRIVAAAFAVLVVFAVVPFVVIEFDRTVDKITGVRVPFDPQDDFNRALAATFQVH